LIIGVACCVFCRVNAVAELAFQDEQSFCGQAGVLVGCPSNTTVVELETTDVITGDSWQKTGVQRLSDYDNQTGFLRSMIASSMVAYARCVATTNNSLSERRMRMLHNGHFLTVSPRSALSILTATNRHRLFVVYSILVDPDTGRIAAIYPPFDTDGVSCTVTARPVNAAIYSYLATNEVPPPPPDCASSDAVVSWWQTQGIAASLFTNLDIIDLKGAVVTPGIIDGHLHVSSWSKKLPDEGEQFGFYADVSDPSYYIDPDTGDRYDADRALANVVSNANEWLSSNTDTGIFLHGFVYTEVETILTNEDFEESFVYRRDAGGCGVVEPNTNYQLNGIARGPDPQPAILIHTSGQSCWVNAELIGRFNELMGLLYSNRFDEVAVTNIVPPAGDESLWTFEVGPHTGGGHDLFEHSAPITVDLVVDAAAGLGAQGWVPFELTALSNSTRTAYGEPVIQEVADKLTGTLHAASFVPYYRPIPLCISTTVWNEAADFHGDDPEQEGPAYGQWDPRNPYDSNWYNGAERGLMEYFFDEDGQVWRPSGYAEHYVMRDLLGSIVIAEITTDEAIRSRRNLARWCHRHGITSVQDIMYYRRRTNPEDFYAYEALSYEHDYTNDPDFFTDRGIDPATRTGHYNLRVGMYYYLENRDQIEDVLGLAVTTNGSDVSRLAPDAAHPEYPGWIHWTGWKLQLDGGTGARTFYSSAPVVKTYGSDLCPVDTEDGGTITFSNHSFGLLTMTSDQEQVFDGRESAALYWLVRESDPAHGEYNPALSHNWTWLRQGVVNWVGLEINEANLASDLRLLNHVDMTVTNYSPKDEAAIMAAKIPRLLSQVNSGFSNTLSTLIRLWYEKSVATNPLPHQVACHCDGDAGVDLWLRAIWQLRHDVTNLPTVYGDLPGYWQDALPDDPDMAAIDRGFTNERYRVEHLLNFAPSAINLIRNPTNGIDRGTLPASRNVVFSTQPALLGTDGMAFRIIGFPAEQELWGIPCGVYTNFWRGLPAIPRYQHHMPCPLYIDYDIPFALNTDPPSVRDPRPAMNIMAAVSRCPVEPDPAHWLDQNGDVPAYYPPDYLVSKVYMPLGLTTGPVNRMQLTVEQALTAMTFWSAYNAGLEYEQGAIASPWTAPGYDGWFADFVILGAQPVGDSQ